METYGYDGGLSEHHARPETSGTLAQFDAALGEAIPRLWAMYSGGLPALSRKNFHAANGVESCDARLVNGLPTSTSCGCVDEFQTTLAETVLIIRDRLAADADYQPVSGRSWLDTICYVFRTSAASNIYRAKRSSRCALVNTNNLIASETYRQLPDAFTRALFVAAVEAAGSLSHYSVDDTRPFHGYLAQRLAAKGLGSAPDLLDRIPEALAGIRALANRVNRKVRPCHGVLVDWWDGMVEHALTDHVAALGVTIDTVAGDGFSTAYQLASKASLVEDAVESRLAPVTLEGVDERIVDDLATLPDDESSPILRVLLSSYAASIARGVPADDAVQHALYRAADAGVLEQARMRDLCRDAESLTEIRLLLEETMEQITG